MKTHAEMGQLDGGFIKALEDLGQARALNKELLGLLKELQGKSFAKLDEYQEYEFDKRVDAAIKKAEGTK